MMKSHPAAHRPAAVVLAAVLLTFLVAASARAVIKPDMDVGGQRGLYSVASRVLIGKVTAVDPAARCIELEMAEDISSSARKGRGEPFEPRQRVNLAAAPEVLEHARVGAPAVLVAARVKGGMVHVADCFCPVGESPAGSPPTWTVDRTEPWKVFPGVTAAFIEALRDAMQDRFSDLNSVPHWMIPRYRKVLALKAAPKFLVSADASGDGVPDLVVGFPDGTVAFHVATAGGYEQTAFRDATAAWGLAGARASAAALGDASGDGRPDLLLDDVLYLNEGARFAPSPAVTKLPAGAKVLAAGIGDADADGKNDALLVTRAGDLYVYKNGPATAAWEALPPRSLWKEDPANPTQQALFGAFGYNGNAHLMVVRSDGPVRYAVDERDGRPADIEHLALAFKGQLKLPFRCLAVAPMRTVRGTGRGGPKIVSGPSFLMLTPGGRTTDLALMNRGYGVYVMNGRMGLFRHKRTEGHKSGGAKGALLITPVAATAADFNRADGIDELLFATADGNVYEGDNIGFAFDSMEWVNETP